MTITKWRVRIRRADGNDCFHLAADPCPLCDLDRLRSHNRPIQAPLAVSFHLPAYAGEGGQHGLEQTAFSPWERPHDIESRGELLQFCEKNNLDSKYLKESMHWSHRKPREI